MGRIGTLWCEMEKSMLNTDERRFAIDLAKQSLKNFLFEQNTSITAEDIKKKFGPDSALLAHLGCFVTLKRDHQLRGCIGTIISDDPLYENIMQNAISSGIKDPRFDPVEMSEWEELEFEISVMGALTPIHPEAVVVGTHGLIMKNGHHQGLLLPQVPLEWNWDRKEFLEQTCIKAGLARNAYQDPDTEIYSFTAEVFSENDVK
jgi:AmmeMemoRadiSam system protein A